MTLFGGVTPSSDSQQTQQTMTYRVLDYMYGSGYEAIAPDGANANVDTWQFTWDNITQSQYTSLLAWLQANPPWVNFAGDGAILPTSRTYRVTNDGYQFQPMPGEVWSCTFNVQEVF